MPPPDHIDFRGCRAPVTGTTDENDDHHDHITATHH
jgi:hypothetical protein